MKTISLNIQIICLRRMIYINTN